MIQWHTSAHSCLQYWSYRRAFAEVFHTVNKNVLNQAVDSSYLIPSGPYGMPNIIILILCILSVLDFQECILYGSNSKHKANYSAGIILYIYTAQKCVLWLYNSLLIQDSFTNLSQNIKQKQNQIEI